MNYFKGVGFNTIGYENLKILLGQECHRNNYGAKNLWHLLSTCNCKDITNSLFEYDYF